MNESSHLFRALVSRDEYTKTFMADVKDTFFGGSFSSLLSFFAREEMLSRKDVSELREIIDSMEAGNQSSRDERKVFVI